MRKIKRKEMKYITKIIKSTSVDVKDYMAKAIALINYKPTAEDYESVKKELTEESKVQFEEKTDLEKENIVIGFIKMGNDFKNKYKELGINFAYELALDYECVGDELDKLAIKLSDDESLTMEKIQDMDIYFEYTTFIADFLMGTASAFSSAPMSTATTPKE